jgi:hypothetical protein
VSGRLPGHSRTPSGTRSADAPSVQRQAVGLDPVHPARVRHVRPGCAVVACARCGPPAPRLAPMTSSTTPARRPDTGSSASTCAVPVVAFSDDTSRVEPSAVSVRPAGLPSRTSVASGCADPFARRTTELGWSVTRTAPSGATSPHVRRGRRRTRAAPAGERRQPAAASPRAGGPVTDPMSRSRPGRPRADQRSRGLAERDAAQPARSGPARSSSTRRSTRRSRSIAAR